MQFITAVGNVLRVSGIIRGDTDLPVSFSDQQHAATLNLAIIAIQTTLMDIAAYYQLPAERTSGSITLVHGQVNYPLPTNFMEFWNEPAYFYDSINNLEIFNFKGGEQLLARTDYQYKTVQGYPNWFYMVDGVAKTVGFYQVPDAEVNGRVLTFDYNKNVIPLIETDILPFQDDNQALMFCNLASVKFDALFSKQAKLPSLDVQKDPNYISSRADLLRMMNPIKAPRRYGRIYNAGKG